MRHSFLSMTDSACPDARGVVPRRRHHPLAVAAERRARHGVVVWPFRTAISLSASQMRAVLSQDAVTTRLPSPLNVALDRKAVWPFRTAICFPLSAFQMRAVGWGQPAPGL